ncbi:MAG: hypothetical protein Kow00107_10690 [Planctomycetota bacterium]
MPVRRHLFYPHVAGYTFEKPNVHDIGLAEHIIGHTLPKEYVELIMEQNGGLLRYNTHASPIPNSWAEDHVPVESIWGISVNGDLCINSAVEKAEKWRLPKGIVPFTGDSWGCVCFDYRCRSRTAPPAIVWAESAEILVPIVADFGSFLEGLVRGEPKHVFGIGEGADVRGFIAELAEKEGLELAEDEEELSGIVGRFSRWRSLSDPSQPADLWLTDNRRPNGWIEYPEWDSSGTLLSIDIRREDFEEFLQLVAGHLGSGAVELHRPKWRS